MTEKITASQTPLNTALDALSNKYRRRLLVELLENHPQDDENPQIPADVDIEDENLESLKIEMAHTHLPKLEGSGFVDWERDTNRIRKGPQFEEIRPLLKLIHDHADELPQEWL